MKKKEYIVPKTSVFVLRFEKILAPVSPYEADVEPDEDITDDFEEL